MKHKLPLILLAVALILVTVGVVGLCSRRSNRIVSPTQQPYTTTKQNASLNSLVAEDLLDVASAHKAHLQIKDYEGFRVAFNADNHTPDWVAWELLGAETDGTQTRHNKFWSDPELNGCPETSDYSNSGYDRGHMCPAADQKWSQQAMIDCFSLANICPQDHKLNTGAWKTLENKERQWAQRDSALVIIAGPIYSESDNIRVGKRGVRVPGAFFKILAAPYLPSPRGIAFVYPNMTAPGNMQNYVMTIRDVEKLTGYDFLSALPDDIEERMETTVSFNEWNKK